MEESINVLGEKLAPCSTDPMTGWFRDGCCNTDNRDFGRHVVCVVMTDIFLAFSKGAGNDLSSPGPGFSGLKGVVTKIIGDPGDPRNDFERVVRQYDLPRYFSSQVVKDFESRLKMFDAEILRRVDYREQKCFTIDPEDAKDFDDALYIEPVAGSGFRLWVHIADVSFFVTEGSKLDEEVCARGTSVYLIDRTIHMLPENLASNYCSLVLKLQHFQNQTAAL